MILDSLSNLERYASILPQVSLVANYLKSVNVNNIPEGKHLIDGDRLFVTSAINDAKTKEAAKLEAHNKYVDIQVCLSSAETFGWADREACKNQIGSFDEQKDIVFFSDKPSSYVTIGQLCFVLFMPNDAHAPLIGDGKIKKLIFKVKIA